MLEIILQGLFVILYFVLLPNDLFSLAPQEVLNLDLEVLLLLNRLASNDLWVLTIALLIRISRLLSELFEGLDVALYCVDLSVDFVELLVGYVALVEHLLPLLQDLGEQRLYAHY